MATQQSKASKINMCDKCGSEMIRRIISLREKEKVRHKPIWQCKICRHWVAI